MEITFAVKIDSKTNFYLIVSQHANVFTFLLFTGRLIEAIYDSL